MINEAFPKAPAFCLRPVGCSWPKCECEGENNAMNAADARARCSPEPIPRPHFCQSDDDQCGWENCSCLCLLKAYRNGTVVDATAGPTDTAPPRAGGVGWFCPMCDRHHAPSVETCPGDHKRVTVKINPMSWSEVRRSYATQYGPHNPAYEVKTTDEEPTKYETAIAHKIADWLTRFAASLSQPVISRHLRAIVERIRDGEWRASPAAEAWSDIAGKEGTDTTRLFLIHIDGAPTMFTLRQIEAIVEKMWRKTGHDLWKMTPTEIAGKEGDKKTSRICLLIDAQTKAFTLQQLAAIVRLLESKTGFDLSDMSPEDIGKLNP